MNYYIVFFTLLASVFTVQISADEPVMDIDHAISTSNWIWRIDSEHDDTLLLRNNETGTVSARYDLAECMFCSGEDDGCEQDGIFALQLETDPGQPLIVAVCHIGAHSRKLQIFAPLKNTENAVHTVTGDFIIDYAVDPGGITVHYDVRKSDGEFLQKSSRWPSKDTSE